MLKLNKNTEVYSDEELDRLELEEKISNCINDISEFNKYVKIQKKETKGNMIIYSTAETPNWNSWQQEYIKRIMNGDYTL